MIPVLSFVGGSGVGKTTLLVKLIAELTRRGFSVGTVKHTHHELAFDQKGKDSARHVEAGAVLNAISSPNGFALTAVKAWPLADILALFCNVDIIIVEGYKHEPLPKIEVLRQAHSTISVVQDDPHLIGVVSDFAYNGSLPHFDLHGVIELANFIEARFLQ